MLAPCCGCGGLFDPVDGPVHAYMAPSPGCWAAYSAVLTREYEDATLFRAAHRFTVDAYALQHPGRINEIRATRSVWLHFASLDAVFRRGASHDAARAVLQDLAGRAFPALPPMPAMNSTVAAMPSDAAGHVEAAEQWAHTAYSAWLPLLGPYAARLSS